MAELPSDEWQIFLRRHPANPAVKTEDAEQLLWTEFENIPNVFIIDPQSPVDSIALGMRADLVFNYWSIIAIELIARGSQNVFTMGPSPWQSLLPERQINSGFSLPQTLEILKKKISPEQIIPLCFYLNKHGIDFQITKYLESEKNWRHLKYATRNHQ